jgi:DNA polymerase-3 subunit alpha
MPTDLEIKAEILAAVSSEYRERVIPELDTFLSREQMSEGKSTLQKFYSQWKSGKKGHYNPHNSWMGYCLGLTDKKPLNDFKFDKRRFFARPSPPDVDSDFDYRLRDKVIAYIISLYTQECVGHIGTMGGLKLKSALTRIIKTLDIAKAWKEGDDKDYTTRNVEKVREILGSLPRQRGAILSVKDDDGEHAIKNTIDATKYCKDFRFYMEKHPEILKHAANIEGLLSTFGVHASGIIVSDTPLAKIAPLRTAKEKAKEAVFATQFTQDDLEKLGLIKIDILGISTITVIADCIKLIKDYCGIDINLESLSSVDDPKTYETYKSGQLCGVFQCESKGMQETCINIGVDRFEDIMAALALYRPGPLDSIPQYCARKKGEERISYFHPTIEPHVKHILGVNYGLLVYQEDIMRICEALADMTPTEALMVIKGIGKKLPEVVQKGRTSFIKGCVKKGVPEEVATQYWDNFITPFAGYGFNNSHACCYGFNSYLTAYFKTHYPEEFLTASMNVCCEERYFERDKEKEDKDPPGCKELEAEAIRLGIKVLHRDINKCSLAYEIVKKKDEQNGIMQSEIRPPLHCKGLPTAAAVNIAANRPYASIKELAEKTNSSVGEEAVIALADAGFFKTRRDKLVAEFKMVRDDIKALNKLGRESVNMFE